KDPKYGLARLRLADALLMVPDTRAGIIEYIKAATLMPADLEAQIKAASMLIVVREYEEARVCAERALKVDGRNVAAQVLHANALTGLKKFEAAMAEIQEAMELDPTKSLNYRNIAVLQAGTGNPEQ